MKEFINALTGTRMFVDDEREEEYRKAGHRPADLPAQEAEPTLDHGEASEPETPAEPPAKKTAMPRRKPAAKK